jgi:hypothetical protein
MDSSPDFKNHHIVKVLLPPPTILLHGLPTVTICLARCYIWLRSCGNVMLFPALSAVLPISDPAGHRVLPLAPRAPQGPQAPEPAHRPAYQFAEARGLWVGQGVRHSCPDVYSRGMFCSHTCRPSVILSCKVHVCLEMPGEKLSCYAFIRGYSALMFLTSSTETYQSLLRFKSAMNGFSRTHVHTYPGVLLSIS